VRLVGDLVWSVLAGLVVVSGLGFVGAGATLGVPGELAWVGGTLVAVGMFTWRRQDPDFWMSDRERLERQLFGREP
jgi:hypothetical protein